jgi:hypothetical protein
MHSFVRRHPSIAAIVISLIIFVPAMIGEIINSYLGVALILLTVPVVIIMFARWANTRQTAAKQAQSAQSPATEAPPDKASDVRTRVPRRQLPVTVNKQNRTEGNP